MFVIFAFTAIEAPSSYADYYNFTSTTNSGTKWRIGYYEGGHYIDHWHFRFRLSSIDALDAFKNNPGDFDLVITDMTMPNMTGDILAKTVRMVLDEAQPG
ncbi:hypothetical protein [uncultured Desulfobacter sp.]|uniref:hypothetical protein n=1 Tax=uncultured Desulfobacter sp. TaxID=240139 RepID=UPI0029F50FE3|nr:hypothetical protein [uncultured Desulfobacter sp.]